MFWGLFLGIALIAIFMLKIITASILVPFLVVYIVIQCFMGSPDAQSLYFGSYKGDFARCSIILGNATINLHSNTVNQQGAPIEYKTIMGASTIDLTELDMQTLRAAKQALIVQCDNTLGFTHLKVAKEVPIYITAKAFLGSVELPGPTTVVLGSHTYRSHPQEHPLLVIYSTTILGKTIIERI